jgi:ketohexokinase
MLRILLTGVTTLDIINTVDEYPTEDSEVRASEQALRMGGNACNSAQVIQQLGHHSSLLCTFADDAAAEFIQAELRAQQIDISHCPTQASSATPTSYITLSRATGSRSIVHYRRLDELDAQQFAQLPLASYHWCHFEARNCVQLLDMLQQCKASNRPVSLELEKPRDALEPLLPLADVLLISRPFAETMGFSTAQQCLQHFSQRFADAIISCSWGDQGAWLYDRQQIIHQPAFPVARVVDSLGAGDTYNAGLISQLAQNIAPAKALAFACALAANKCTQTGFSDLTLPQIN